MSDVQKTTEYALNLALAIKRVSSEESTPGEVIRGGMVVALSACLLHVEKANEEELKCLDEGAELIKELVKSVRAARRMVGA